MLEVRFENYDRGAAIDKNCEMDRFVLPAQPFPSSASAISNFLLLLSTLHNGKAARSGESKCRLITTFLRHNLIDKKT